MASVHADSFVDGFARRRPALLGGAADAAQAFLGRASLLPGPDVLHQAARRRTGLDRSVAEPALEALGVLTASLRSEARLSAFGLIATRRDLVGKLANLLMLDDLEAADPAISSRRIASPVFITGLPRSGTSFLHALLAENPSVKVPLAWQTAFPVPDHPSAARHAGPDRFGRQLALFSRLVPELASLHPLSADAPQECIEIMAHTFRSLRYDSTHDVPSYRAWLDRTGHDEAYQFHRRFLRHLQGRREARWVLKSPDHISALPALRRTYPDARLVLVHRDPLRVMASVARLTELLRRPFARGVDRMAIGRQVMRDWQAGLRTILGVTDAIHVRHADLLADPVGTVRGLCRQLDIEAGEADRRRVAAYVAARPRGGYGRNHYSLSAYGIDPAELEPLRRRYLSRFDVRPEAVAEPGTGPR